MPFPVSRVYVRVSSRGEIRDTSRLFDCLRSNSETCGKAWAVPFYSFPFFSLLFFFSYMRRMWNFICNPAQNARPDRRRDCRQEKNGCLPRITLTTTTTGITSTRKRKEQSHVSHYVDLRDHQLWLSKCPI